MALNGKRGGGNEEEAPPFAGKRLPTAGRLAPGGARSFLIPLMSSAPGNQWKPAPQLSARCSVCAGGRGLFASRGGAEAAQPISLGAGDSARLGQHAAPLEEQQQQQQQQQQQPRPCPRLFLPRQSMKAISPVRSVRSCYEAVCCLSEQSVAIARGGGKSAAALEEPMSLLYDMNDCYSKLRELVPGIPQGSKVSQVEILQHVIDYIFDLQIVLEEQAAHPGQEPPSAQTSLLSLTAAELASELCSKEERNLCH